MKYFKQYKTLSDFANHKVDKHFFSFIKESDSILVSNKDNALTVVDENDKPTIDNKNKVVADADLKGTYNSPDSDLYIVDSIVKGGKESGNAKIITDDSRIVLNSITVSSDAENGIYNVFEQPQKPKEILDKYTASNITVKGENLKHNVFNIYNVNDEAIIMVRDCKFDLNMKTSNAMRLANYTNATGVTVIFKNIEWTYENVPYTDEDITWAGLVIYQPAGNDNALNGDLSALKTWTFKFENCSYAGTPIKETMFGTNHQIMYLYNIGKSGDVSNPITEGLKIEFA